MVHEILKARTPTVTATEFPSTNDGGLTSSLQG